MKEKLAIGHVKQALQVRYPMLLLLAGIWIAIVSFLLWDHRQEIDSGQRQSATLSESLAAHAEQVLLDAERLSHVIEREVRIHGINTSLQHFLPGNGLSEQPILQLALVDLNGILQSSSLKEFEPIDLSDREHIQVHLKGQVKGLFISTPVIGRASGRLSVQLSRRLTGHAGELLGVLVISIDPVQLTERYRKLDIGTRGLIALIGTNDRIIRMVRSREHIPGLDVGSEQPHLLPLLHKSAPEIQSAPASPELAQKALLLSAAQVANFPLAVVVGLSTHDLLAAYSLRQTVLLSAAALLTLITLMAEIGRWRMLKRARASDQQLSQALDQVSSRERRMANLFRAIPDPAIAFSQQGNQIEGCNPPMAKLLGWNEKETESAMLHSFAERVFQTDISQNKTARINDFYCSLEKALTTDHPPGVTRFEIQLDTPAPITYEVRLESLQDDPVGLLVLLRDITAQNRLERMTNDFAATAAHELRTPLASILGFSELLAADLVPESTRGHVAKQIRQRAATMTELVNDLLTLTRLDTGRGSGQHKDIDLRSIIDPLLKHLPEASSRLSIELPSETIRVSGNMPELVTALRNGVENALKYDTTGQRIILSMVSDAENGQAHILIRDHGPGIRSEDTERVFRRFVRLNTTGSIEGSGLGLPLVRSVMQHHKGWAWVESAPGQGLTLHMTLPLQTA